MAAIMPRVDTSPLRAHVGAELYEQACRWAWATAAGTGRLPDDARDATWPEEVLDVPHELEGRIWDDARLSWSERVELMLALYREMPCYATLMYAGMSLSSMDDDGAEGFWAGIRGLLDEGDDRLADPVAYWLWSGPFEHSDREARAAWSEVTVRPATEQRLERVLERSGPIPYRLKQHLYDELEPEERWHPWILKSLVGSAFDVFGRIDRRDARRRLARLRVDDVGGVVPQLREKLSR
jgi:hypothetical protein